MKFVLTVAAASLLASIPHPAFGGQIKAKGPQKSQGKGKSRGKRGKVNSKAGDLAVEQSMSIQGSPGKRTAQLKRKGGAAGSAANEWYGETDSGDAVANLRPCRHDPTMTCGSLADYNEGVVYNFRTDVEGETVVDATPYEAYPPDADPQELLEPETVGEAESPDRRGLRRAIEKQADAAQAFRAAVARPAEDAKAGGLRQSRRLQTEVMDVMVIWTKKAECAAAGAGTECTLTTTTTDNMLDLVDLAVQETNQAYSNSGIDASLRLVHAYLAPNYVEASSDAFGTALDDITFNSGSAVLDDQGNSVHALRTATGADIVALLIDDGQYCGLGWLGPFQSRMFSISSWSCATGYYTFGHEIGHNQGCNHDRGTKGTCTESGTYDYGWRDPVGQFRTIMAYNCRTGQCDNNPSTYCPKVQQFSNQVNNAGPSYGNRPVGDAANDNARQINDVRATVAAYFPAKNGCMLPTECDDADVCTEDICTASGVCTNPPISCDDNDACTADTCTSPSIGCVNTPISCDDGNACTVDSCDSGSGCVNTPISNCCGNNICEAGEDATSCATDCALGPFDLTTPYCSSCTILDGLMFDIKTTTSKIQVQTLGIRTYAPTGTFEVWTRSGTHVGFKNSLSGWTQIAEYTFSAAAWATVEIPSVQFTAQDIDPAIDSGVRAFYVTIQNQATEDRILVTGGTAVGTLVSQDTNGIQVLEGSGKPYPVSGSNYGGAWIFNGNVEYLKIPDAPAPTPAPVTPAPTDAPTDAPTGNPTKAPTDAPTKAPTDTPTDAPVTPAPTKAPTNAPTDAPTKALTNAPTDAPTKAPTNAPTDTPTKAPTNAPTNTPTKAPTNAPTDAPTKAPTNTPTDAPSKAPVMPGPTDAPTKAPTNAPTKAPTNTPTKAPVTPAPTDAPTKAPTNAPTDTPTKAPTNAPTDTPTKAPITPAPTDAPTKAPTDALTKAPTNAPTKAPITPAPTGAPTDAPTKAPTNGSFYLACGSSAGGCKGQKQAAQVNTLHEVRCCVTSAVDLSASGWNKNGGCPYNNVWGESVLGGPRSGCYDAETHDSAANICAQHGGRLCTTDELLGDCTRGSGCSHDQDMIWSSDPAVPTAAPTDRPTAAPSSASPTATMQPTKIGAVGETGRVPVSDLGTAVDTRYTYVNPVVVAFINTREGDESVDVRVKDVTKNSFRVFLEEAPGTSDPTHTEEEVSFIVMEEGRHELEGGLIVQAGLHSTSRVHRKGQAFTGDQINFISPFSTTPAVLATLNSYNNAAFMSSLTTTVTTGSFQISQEALETNSPSVLESIGWMAFSTTPGVGTTSGGSPYIAMYAAADTVKNGVTQTAHSIDLSPATFNELPDLVVNVYGEYGTDGSYARGAGIFTTTTQTVYAEEDVTTDAERNHASEPWAWVGFAHDTDIFDVSN